MKYILLLLTILTIGCTKEIIIEVPVQNPVNINLQNQLRELQGIISNLTATNLNLESQISLLESEADILNNDISSGSSEISDLQDRIEELENEIERFNIELSSNQSSFLRLNFSQAKNTRVLDIGSWRLSRIGVYDSANSNDDLWFEEAYGIPDGKELPYSETASWDYSEQVRFWYDSDGVLSVIQASPAVEAQDNRPSRTFYVEAFDYIYELENAINEYIN